jgi:triosephosphate isomerase
MKQYIVAGNWKMHKDVQEANIFVLNMLKNLLNQKKTNIILCPPFTALFNIHEIIKNTPIGLGGQNMHSEPKGAFTGEISGEMLLSAGCQYVILGHSERRHVFGESDDFIREKVKKALAVGLKPIICVGEKLEQRQAGQTLNVVRSQCDSALSVVSENDIQRCVIAYEPVWAIGTGVVATPEQASEAHTMIRKLLAVKYGEEIANSVPILYGGSVKSSNAMSLIYADDIDGFLIGGASLVEDEFVRIAEIVDDYVKQKES